MTFDHKTADIISHRKDNSIIPDLLTELEESRPDINADGQINILDILSLIDLIINELGDINQDGEVNIIDIMVIVNVALN